MAEHVHLRAGDEVVERGERDRVAARRVGDGGEHEIVRLAQAMERRADAPSRASFSSVAGSPSAMSSMRRARA